MTDVENINAPLALCHAVDHSIYMWSAAKKKITQSSALKSVWTSVRHLFQAQNRVNKPEIPFACTFRGFSANIEKQRTKVALRAR
jgi:hypothetical protein